MYDCISVQFIAVAQDLEIWIEFTVNSFEKEIRN